MFFEPELRVPIPATDILTYIFANPYYDPNKPVYIDASNPTRSISLVQARTSIRQLIAGLGARGIYYCMLVLAIIGLGGIYTGTNPSYTSLELGHHFRTAEVRFVLSEPEILGPVLEAAKAVGIRDSNVRILNTLSAQLVPEGKVSWTELFNHGEENWIEFDDDVKSRTTAAARLFSSGTTGETALSQHPSHAAAAPSTHVGALKSGHTVYMMRRFDLPLFLQTCIKYQITDLTLVPPLAIALLMDDMTHEKPYLRSVRSATCGAAPLDKSVQRRLGRLRGPGAPFTQAWGMTETTCVAIYFAYPESDDTGSVGRLVASVEAKLVDDQGKNISAYDTRSELCVRGPTATPGYFNNPAANAESFDEDGWFHTGDNAYCDAESRKWYIVDRKKELIKVRGFQVAPPEIEAVLLSPRLLLMRRRPGKGEGLTEAEVRGHLEGKLAKYKALTGGVKFVEVIPKNASGKILKRVLREGGREERQGK
ncbi:hypothetical protein BDW66DRAFT_165913 [Aspergillus desertorum]